MDTHYIILSKKKKFELNTLYNCIWVGGAHLAMFGAEVDSQQKCDD